MELAKQQNPKGMYFMMDSTILTKRISTAMTGMVQPPQQQGVQPTTTSEGESFQAILQKRLSENSDLRFSKHAVNRVMERNVDISESAMARLNEGVKLAQEKGLNDTLILVDATAYIVNAKKGTVITTVSNSEIKGNVFTNIEGTVIM